MSRVFDMLKSAEISIFVEVSHNLLTLLESRPRLALSAAVLLDLIIDAIHQLLSRPVLPENEVTLS